MTNETNKTDTTKLAEALALWLGCEADELEEARHDCYGLTVLEHGGDSYAIGTDEECDNAVASYIESSVWAFRTSFILSCCDLPEELEDAIASFQHKECEGANEALRVLIEKCCCMEEFTRRAISADGRGHFLASYDGDEISLGNGLFAYRIG